MLVSKYIGIEFSDPRIRAIDAIQDIREATSHAGLNLYSRFDVQLQYPMPKGNQVVVEIKIPDTIVDTFSIGNHLRGISSYLLKKYPKYEKYVVGKRLLSYYDYEKDTLKDEKDCCIAMLDRFEAVEQFVRLLKRTDSRSGKYISQIISILEEANEA